MKRAILTTLAWLLAMVVAYSLILVIELNCNLFNWSPEWNWRAELCVTAVAAWLIGLYYVSREIRHKSVLVLACVASVALLIPIFIALPPEAMGGGHVFAARSQQSPVWYRWGRLLVGLVPLALCVVSYVRLRRASIPPAIPANN